MGLEDELRQAIEDAVTHTEAGLLASLSGDTELLTATEMFQVLAAKLNAVHLGLLRLAREFDDLTVGPTEEEPGAGV